MSFTAHPRAGILEDGLDLGKLRRILDRRRGDARAFALDTDVDTHSRLQPERLADGGGENDLSLGRYKHGAHHVLQKFYQVGILHRRELVERSCALAPNAGGPPHPAVLAPTLSRQRGGDRLH